MDDVVDYTACKCGHKCAEIVQGESGFYATCPSCGRTSMEQSETIEEAVFVFKDDNRVEYQ